MVKLNNKFDEKLESGEVVTDGRRKAITVMLSAHAVPSLSGNLSFVIEAKPFL